MEILNAFERSNKYTDKKQKFKCNFRWKLTDQIMYKEQNNALTMHDTDFRWKLQDAGIL